MVTQLQATSRMAACYRRSAATFATVNGQITIAGAAASLRQGCPVHLCRRWGEATFARMALMGSWHADHNAFYMGRHGVSVYNQQYQD